MSRALVLFQIIFESLPISSSSHIFFLSTLFDSACMLPESVYYAAHAPTVMMLGCYFARELFFITHNYKQLWDQLVVWALGIGIANSITIIGYIVLHVVHVPFSMQVGLMITTGLLLSLVWCKKLGSDRLSINQAVVIGIVQAISLLPGISRLAMTYVVGRWIGLSWWASFRFSCALEATLFAAASAKSLLSLLLSGYSFTLSFVTIMSIVMAMCIAYLLLWFVEYLMKTGHLWYFGWYMIVPTFFSFFF
ncbi:MAG: undecaprenyl-diphosphate phosphatase [Candidatus Babeliaceae bacterium]